MVVFLSSRAVPRVALLAVAELTEEFFEEVDGVASC
jgi:hypothetical protein